MNRRQGVVKSGTCLLSEEPFVYTLSCKYRTTRCDFCLKSPPKLFKCSGCLYVFYCGAQCQSEGWSEHKHECGKIKTYQTKDIPDGMRMMAKIVIKLQNSGGYRQKSYYSKTEFRKFRDLMSHEQEIREDSTRMEYFETCIVPFITNFFEQSCVPTTKELLQIYGKMAVNSFSVLDGEDMNSIGSAIYLGASILDHNCVPNAVATFEGRTLKIRTIQEMSSLNWDKVFISYIDLMDDTETRRSRLKKNYYFLCTCSKCVCHDKEETLMYAAACPKCSEAYKVSKNGSACSKCSFIAPKRFIDDYADVTEFSKLKLSEMTNTAYLDLSKICLNKQKDVLHPMNLLHVKTLDIAFDSAVTLGKFEEAAEFGRALVPGFVKYHGDWNPLAGILLLKLGKLLDYLHQDDEAEELLLDAERILKVTHGETSGIYKDVLVPLLQAVTNK